MENHPTETTKQTYVISPIKLVTCVYILYIIGCFTGGVGAIIGIILANLQKKETNDTVLLNHLNYQISIFWPTFCIGLLGLITMPIGIGFIITIANIIWFAYRSLFGFLKLNKNESIK